MTRAYPFILARNQYFDQRPVVVPAIWDVDSIKRTVTEESDGLYSRDINLRGRAFRAVWRNTALRPEFVGLSPAASVTDPNGREITWTEGMLLEGRSPSDVGLHAFEQLRMYILSEGHPEDLRIHFWECNSSKEFQALNWQPFELELRQGTAGSIRELAPMPTQLVREQVHGEKTLQSPIQPLSEKLSSGQGQQTMQGCLLPITVVVGAGLAYALWAMMHS